jgi:hypothetical protein
MEKDLLICSPHDYYSVCNQDSIARLCARDNRQWIYALISAGMSAHDEVVMTETAQWLLCLDKHPGEDTRYLVVFRDLALKTIRDLRGRDVPMLLEMLASVRAQMLARHPEWARCQVYFHYYPSVYQLHAHVCEDSAHASARKASCRCHEVGHVVRNLRTDPQWYAKALILTNRPRHAFRSAVRACRAVSGCETDRWEIVLRRCASAGSLR